MTKYEIRYLDCCTPGYFQGFSGPVDCMPVDGNTTVREVADWLKDAFDSARFDDEEFFDMDWDATYNEWLNLQSRLEDAIAFPTLDVPSEDDQDITYEGPYAYFGLVKVED